MAITVQGASINTGSSSMGAMISQHWSKKGLLLAYPTLNFIDLARDGGKNAWLKIPARKGKVINFFKEPIDDPSYTTYNESADDPSPSTWVLTASSATAELYLKSRVLTDLGEGIALVSPTVRVAKGLAFWGMRTFNGLIGGAISAGGTDYYCGDATSASDLTSTDVLTRDELDILAMKLEAQNIRTYMNGLWKYRAHPVTLQAIRADTGTNNFWELVKYINEVKGYREDFLVGKTSNFEIKSSTEVNSTSAISAADAQKTGFYNLWAGMESIGAVDLAGPNLPGKDVQGTPDRMTKKPKWEPDKANFHIMITQPGGQADPHKRRIKVAAKLWVGKKVLNTSACGYHMAGSAYKKTGL